MKKIFKNKKVIIMGLGLHGGGVGTAKFFCKQEADVLVTDLKSKEQLEESIEKLKGFKIDYILGRHREEDFIKADFIIKNPDVPNTSPYLKLAKKNNIPIETDVSLFFNFSGAYIIGVTGTKGKSTTASLIYHLLKPIYKRVFLSGNIGISPLELLLKIKKGDKVILELSSFELENLKQSPNIVVITNILPDHLNRYKNMSEYINTKKIIFKYQKKNDVLILNYDDPVVRRFAKEAKEKVYFFSFKEKKPRLKLDNYKLAGQHNIYNLLAAVSVAKLLKVPPDNIQTAIGSFKGISSRQEFVKEISGVKYFNDTTATMPGAVEVAIKSFLHKFPKSKIILIAGGQDKNLDYKMLAKNIKKNIFNLIMLPGTASDKIKKELSGWKNIINVLSMQEAVKKASSIAKKGYIVLLSPGAASFNLFKNEFDRGEQFVRNVNRLK